MRSELMLAALICPVLLLVASTSAVTLELSSPQEGASVGPGDTLKLILSISNDKTEKDIVVVKCTNTVAVNGQAYTLGACRGMRLRLDPGQKLTRTIQVTLPTELPSQLPRGNLNLTIQGTATGLKSRTVDTESISLTFHN